MIIDKLLQVSDNQALTATATSTDVIDFGQKTPNIGLNPKPLHMVFTLQAAASGAGKVQFTVQDSEDGNTWADVIASGKLAAADLTEGATVTLPMPVQHKRFVRANYTVEGTVTGAKVSAQVVAGLQLNTPYPDAD